MKTTILLIPVVILTFLSSCKESNSSKNDRKNTLNLTKNDALIIGDPFNYGTDNLVLFPVGSNYTPEVFEKEQIHNGLLKGTVLSFSLNAAGYYDSKANREYINTNENKFDIRNILFYNLETGVSYPLISDTLHILSFALHKDFENPLIFYRVVKNDYNNDSIFNKEDAVMLYVSDLNGNNFTQITPENEHFTDYNIYKESKTILIKTIIDSDNDTCFSNIDETNFREMKISDPKMGKEIFSSSLKDSLRLQLKN